MEQHAGQLVRSLNDAIKEQWPWWDRLLLDGTALLFIFCTTAPLVVADMIFGEGGAGTPLRWACVAIGYIVMDLLFYFVCRRIQEWQFKQAIQRSRREAGFAGQAC